MISGNDIGKGHIKLENFLLTFPLISREKLRWSSARVILL